MTATEEDRRKTAWTVFIYERDMYLSLYDLQFPQRRLPLSSTARNALTESLVLHARNLCDMICDFTPPKAFDWIGSRLLVEDVSKLAFVLARRELVLAYLNIHEPATDPPARVFRDMIDPTIHRGEGFAFAPFIAAIHEPLIAAMNLIVDLIVEARSKAVEAAAHAKVASVPVEPGAAHVTEPGVIKEESPVQASAVEPRAGFAKFTSPDSPTGFRVMINYEHVATIRTGCVAKGLETCTIEMQSGATCLVDGALDEVLAKLEGRA